MQQKIYTLILSFLVIASLPAQDDPVLVKDLNPGVENAFNWWNGITYKDKILFVATDGIIGGELYALKGENITLLKDIYVGAFGSFINDWVHFNDEVYFEAADSAHGYELWKTDGTVDGTVLVHDIATGLDHSFPTLLKSREGLYLGAAEKLYFMPNGTEQLEVIPDVHLPSLITQISLPRACKFRNGIAFVANDREVWTADSKGAEKVHVFTGLPGNATIGGLTATQNGLTMVVNHPDKGGIFIYNDLNKNVEELVGSAGEKLKPQVVADFSSEQTILFSFDDGYYVTNGNSNKTKKILDGKSGVLSGGAKLPLEVINDEIILAPFGENGSDRMVVLDRQTFAVKFELPFKHAFSSPMIRAGNNVLIASGTFTDMEPTLYYYDANSGAGGILHEFEKKSPNYSSVIPVCVKDNKLYFFTNLYDLGRELYIMPTHLVTTSQREITLPEYHLQSQDDLGTFSVQGPTQYEQLRIDLFDMQGRLHETWERSLNETFDVQQPGFFALRVKGQQGVRTFKVFVPE